METEKEHESVLCGLRIQDSVARDSDHDSRVLHVR